MTDHRQDDSLMDDLLEHIFEGDDGQHYFRVVGDNGEIVAQSEGYTRKHDALRGYRALQTIISAQIGLPDECAKRVDAEISLQRLVNLYGRGAFQASASMQDDVIRAIVAAREVLGHCNHKGPIPALVDNTPDAALMLGEEAFMAGWSAALENTMPGRTTDPVDKHTAWSMYEPSEDVKALTLLGRANSDV